MVTNVTLVTGHPLFETHSSLPAQARPQIITVKSTSFPLQFPLHFELFGVIFDAWCGKNVPLKPLILVCLAPTNSHKRPPKVSCAVTISLFFLPNLCPTFALATPLVDVFSPAFGLPRATKNYQRRTPLRCVPAGAKPPLRSNNFVRKRDGHAQNRRVKMAIIGKFTPTETGFSGNIHTPAGFKIPKITIELAEKKSENAPDYVVNTPSGQLGAAWVKAKKNGDGDYISVKLDDPAFPETLYCFLNQNEDGAVLIWDRKKS
jgi:uncharacterized protein (DUF736 family)